MQCKRSLRPCTLQLRRVRQIEVGVDPAAWFFRYPGTELITACHRACPLARRSVVSAAPPIAGAPANSGLLFGFKRGNKRPSNSASRTCAMLALPASAPIAIRAGFCDFAYYVYSRRTCASHKDKTICRIGRKCEHSARVGALSERSEFAETRANRRRSIFTEDGIQVLVL